VGVGSGIEIDDWILWDERFLGFECGGEDVCGNS
jgi:hypothetical protein